MMQMKQINFSSTKAGLLILVVEAASYIIETSILFVAALTWFSSWICVFELS